jgi:hypothetical protein
VIGVDSQPEVSRAGRSCSTLADMTSSDYVIGWQQQQVPTEPPSGTAMTVMRVPHAIRPGLSGDESPVQALCGAQVQEVSSDPWPPGQPTGPMAVPCGFCAVTERA